MEQIIIKNLWKSYDSLTVLKNVDLTLDRDQTYCLMSPSGTGKTTLFRILMGLEKADEGEIVWSASSGSCFGSGSDRDVSRPLRISTVFQEDRLCPHFHL
ncbi:MAG: ATP-binding cassette domain-containing protein [Enterocloster sp.]